MKTQVLHHWPSNPLSIMEASIHLHSALTFVLLLLSIVISAFLVMSCVKCSKSRTRQTELKTVYEVRNPHMNDAVTLVDDHLQGSAEHNPHIADHTVNDKIQAQSVNSDISGFKTDEHTNIDKIDVATCLTIDNLRKVMDIIWPARSMWYVIGINLNLSANDLDCIKAQTDDPNTCVCEMLKIWLKKINPKATWNELRMALNSQSVNRGDIIERLNSQLHNTTDLEVHVPSPDESKDLNAFNCPCGKNCSLDDYFNGKCQPPNIINSMEMFPYLDVRHLDDNDRDKLVQQLYNDTKLILTAFSDTYLQIIESMEKRRLNAEKIADCITSIAPCELFTQSLKTVQEVCSVRRVLISLQHKYITFFNYHLLEYVLKRYGNNREKEMLKQYELQLSEYCKRGVFHVPKGVIGPPPKKSKQFCFKMDEGQQTLVDIKTLQRRIASAFEIPLHTLFVTNVRKGCVQITLSVLESVADAVFPLIDSNSVISDLNIHILPGPPGKPEVIEMSESAIKLCWSKPVFGFSGIQKYIVSYMDSKNTCKSMETSNASVSITLNQFSSLRFKVCAVDDIGKGLDSEEALLNFHDVAGALCATEGTPEIIVPSSAGTYT